MKKEGEDRKLLPIERYSHFKGIYLKTTQEYYLCDFYEITEAGSLSFFRVSADLHNNKQIIEATRNGESWRITPSVLPYELECEIIRIIEEVCIPKSKKSG